MKRFQSSLRSLFITVLSGAALAAFAVGPATAFGADAERPATGGQSLGHRVYMAYCATCHGRTGAGDGPEADGFAQPPTIFTEGTYAFRSTVGLVPAPGDLERSIRIGMPGTEMVPFAAVLSPKSIAAVAAYIRNLSPDLVGEEADEDDIIKIGERPFPRTAETIAEGKEIWDDQGCEDCHLADGRGTNEETDDWDRPVFMVPFQWGYYKSGTTDADLYRSIAAGMLGTTMPAFNEDAEPEEIWKMVDFIRSLDESGDRGLFGSLLGVEPSGFDYSNY